MSDTKDLYAALGVDRAADEDALRKAYRKLARETHPDVNPNDPKAEARFKEIAFAYSVLSDAEKRALYDEFGLAGLSEGFDPSEARSYQQWSEGARRSPHSREFRSTVDLEDLMADFFGGRATGSIRMRGRDVVAEAWVDFADAVLAREVRISVAGRASGASGSAATTLRVKIPPGAQEGTRIRLAGQGEPGIGDGPPGDLTLTLRVRPDPEFTRRGDDLELERQVTIPQLVLGDSIEVRTPDGRAQVKIPANSQNGCKLRLRGKGAVRRTGKRGDLYAKLIGRLPEGDPDALAELARRMEPLYAPGSPPESEASEESA